MRVRLTIYDLRPMSMLDRSADDLLAELLELRSYDPALYGELKSLARSAVLAHRRPRDLLNARPDFAVFLRGRGRGAA